MNNALKSLLRPHYIEMKGYISAGMEVVKTEDKVFLNANENPYELPGLEGLNRYPQPQPEALREAYARSYGVENEWVIMTRGADEAIVALTKLFCEPNKDSVLTCPPTFGMYGVDARAMPAGVVEVPLIKEDGTFKLNHEKIVEKAKDKTENIKIVYICSPNNPTGTSFSHDLISELCEALEGHAVVVLDETYAEFSKQGSMCADLASTPNLIILRTLSKSYALAGMRMGCFICADTDFTALVRAKGLDAYPLPILSIEAAFHALSPEIREMALNNIQTLNKERDRLIPLYKKSKLVRHIFESDANFLLIEMDKAEEFHKFAEENNVILRNFANKPLTENCLRISIGLQEQNDLVLLLLGKFENL